MVRYKLNRPELLGRRIKERREARGLQQQQLAAQAGINQGTLSQIEGGHTKKPEAGTILAIAAALHTSPYLLVFDHVPPEAMEHTIAALVHVWDRLNDRQRLQVIAYAQGLLDASNRQAGDSAKPSPSPSPPRGH